MDEGSPEGHLATARQALAPGWTPGALNPLAWYVASTNDLNTTGNVVSLWKEHLGNTARDLVAGGGQTLFDPAGWADHQPTVVFDGGSLLKADNWTGAPSGTDAGLTVLAVIRSTSSAPQTASIAAWWDPNGGGSAWAGLKASDGRSLLDFARTFGLSNTQAYTSSHDLGTGLETPAPHAVAWRYSPASQTLSLTLDGATTTSSAIPAIGPLPNMTFLVGARSFLPTSPFQGDISELVVTDGSLSDGDVENFMEYARTQWDGLPAEGSTDPCLDAANNPTPPDTTRCDDGNGATYGDHCSTGTCVGTAPPAGSPADLSPIAWYYASAQDVSQRDNGVEIWFDRSQYHHDLSNGFYFSRPTLSSEGWSAGKPSLSFAGHHLLFRDGWTVAPDGAEQEFTVLAVLDPTASKTTGIAAWWSTNGYDRISWDLKTAGSGTVLDLLRNDGNTPQEFTTAADIGLTKHVLAVRYATEHARVTVDGLTVPSDTLSAPGALHPDRMLVGADSAWASTLLSAEIGELSVIPRAITDAELAHFDQYAADEWPGITLACTPDCSGRICGDPDGCGSLCECGTSCTIDTQCVRGFVCSGRQCSSEASHCTNGVQDSDETDVDCGGSCPGCGAGDMCGSDTDCGGGYACGSGTCGGGGAACGMCAAPYGCTDGTCQCTPSCDGKTCGEDDGCGGRCKCSGEACDGDSNCGDGTTCRADICMPSECLSAPQLVGCGTPDALCPSCAPHPICSADSDCPAGYYCPEDNGWRFGLPGLRVCQQPTCDTTPEVLGCGDAFSECGFCFRVPQCQDKQCGDADLSDGIGGSCNGLCQVGQSGCTQDSDCTGGVCRVGICRPSNPCADLLVQPPDCGPDPSTCGPCLNPPPVASDRQCGVDPSTEIDFGGCAEGEQCNADGVCVAVVKTPDVVVSENGNDRTVVPPVSPPSM